MDGKMKSHGQANASPNGVRVGGAFGQAAVEVLAYASFFLLVFAVISAVLLSAQSQELSRAESAYAQEIAYTFADHVRTAFIAGPGFVQDIELSPRLLGKPYVMRLSSAGEPGPDQEIRETGFIYVKWQGQNDQSSFSAPAATSHFLPKYDGKMVRDDSGFILVNASAGTRLRMSSIYDELGKSVIKIEKTPVE